MHMRIQVVGRPRDARGDVLAASVLDGGSVDVVDGVPHGGGVIAERIPAWLDRLDGRRRSSRRRNVITSTWLLPRVGLPGRRLSR